MTDDRPTFFAAVPNEEVIICRSGIELERPAVARDLERSLRAVCDPEWLDPRPPFLPPQKDLVAMLCELRAALVTMGWVR